MLKWKQILRSRLFAIGALAFAATSVIARAPAARAENEKFLGLVEACINQKFGFPLLDKLDQTVKQDFLAIPCVGEPAEKLFDFISPSDWNKDGIHVRETKGLERTERMFGIGGHWGANPSRCWIDRQGKATCLIGLNVHEELTSEMKDAASPFRRAFRGCVAQTATNGGFVTGLYKTPFSELVLTLDCEGGPARKLFEVLPEELDERVPHWSGTFRHFQGEHSGTKGTFCSLSDRGEANCVIHFNLSYRLLE